uniref:Glycosyl transferase family 1 domain-containing protein n=1 Tax=Haptolina ericina TaxID=156174 RepID=A0A7S3EWS6_9EUKA
MRKAGHEVQVFCTDHVKARESSFDHPNLPSITNPYNVHNKMAYNPGVKLAWYLGAKQWDIVHLVYPSNISWAVLPVAAWRRIPIYCSHHVDMEYYVAEYVRFKPLAALGGFLYWLLTKLPATMLAHINAAPTLCFLDSHITKQRGERRRIPTGVADARFKVDNAQQVVEERQDLLKKSGFQSGAEVCIIIMVQRLAPEKDTMKALEAMHALGESTGLRHSLDGKRPTHIVIAGDGPARPSLEQYAAAHSLPVTFLGNVPNDRLPPLYRAADVFVTCSTSETYGLTTLEALACGTPAVLPHCPVFDELWSDKIPPQWMYDTQADGALVEALRCAGRESSAKHMQEHPIKASWADATNELLSQYEYAINNNLQNRQELASYTRIFNQFVKAAIVTVITYWTLRAYTNKILSILTLLLDELIQVLEGKEELQD